MPKRKRKTPKILIIGLGLFLSFAVQEKKYGIKSSKFISRNRCHIEPTIFTFYFLFMNHVPNCCLMSRGNPLEEDGVAKGTLRNTHQKRC